MTHEIPAYLLTWMRSQSKSAFIGDMLEQYRRNGGLTDTQIVEVKVRYIQAGHSTPAMMGVQ